MAQNTEPSDDSKPKERANIVGKTPLDYSKWEDLDFESDEDDCHPNIEIGTWRRLKERMRREKGIKKKEPYLVDKWNVTTTNKNYAIDPTKPPKTTQEQEQKQENTNETNTSNTPPPKDNTKENKPITNDNNNTKESTAKTIEPVTSNDSHNHSEKSKTLTITKSGTGTHTRSAPGSITAMTKTKSLSNRSNQISINATTH
eukprot:187168_1